MKGRPFVGKSPLFGVSVRREFIIIIKLHLYPLNHVYTRLKSICHNLADIV